jgi:predicted ester cyclase
MQNPDRHLANKRFAYAALQRIAEATPAGLSAAIAHAYHPTATWRGAHPLNEMAGTEAIAAQVWAPLLHSFPDLERRDSILVGGAYEGNNLVATIGHYTGTFRRNWLTIPASNRPTNIRSGEVHRIVDGKIAQSTVLIDVLDVIRQAGFQPVPPSTGTELPWPGPFTADGIRLTQGDPDEEAANLAQMRKMQMALGLHGDVATMGRDAFLLPSQTEGWHPKMMWYGPAGIGTTRGIEGFVDGHRLPFRQAFHNTKGSQHYIRIADGPYTVTGGWPSVSTDHLGDNFLGTGATGKRLHMRVMDFYLHHENLIRENWVPLDILHLLHQIGHDVLGRMQPIFRRGQQV